jgi:O-antigen/teichoic acid export membrane protein
MSLLERLRSPRIAHLMDFGLVLGGTAFATGAGFLIKVFLGRLLGPEKLGIFGVCFAFLTVVSVLADLGVRYSLVNLASREADDDPERAKRLVFGGLFLKLLGSLVMAASGWLVAPWLAVHLLHKPELTPFLQITAVGVCVWALWDALEGSLHVRQKFSWGAGCRIIFEALRMLAFAALWGYGDGVYLTLDRYMWLYFLAPVASLAIGAVLLDKLYHPRFHDGKLLNSEELAELVRFSRGIFFFRSASVTLMFLDSIMLTRYGLLSDVGLYEAAKGLAFALLLVSESLQMVLLPKVNQIKTLGQVKALVKRSGRYFAVLFVSAVVWTVVAAPFLGLFGKAFTHPVVSNTFSLMVAVALFTIPSTIFSTVLLTLDKPITLGCIALGQVLLGVVLYPTTIPLGGPMATACTALALQMFGACAYALALRHEVRRREAVARKAGETEAEIDAEPVGEAELDEQATEPEAV